MAKEITKTVYFKDLVSRAKACRLRGWRLLFRFLIVICELLANGKLSKKKRKPSEWSLFAGKYLSAGKSIQEAAKDWSEQKTN